MKKLLAFLMGAVLIFSVSVGALFLRNTSSEEVPENTTHTDKKAAAVQSPVIPTIPLLEEDAQESTAEETAKESVEETTETELEMFTSETAVFIVK